MNLQDNKTVAVEKEFHNCATLRVSDSVWECLEKTRCKRAVSYGGEMFCRHPFTKTISNALNANSIHSQSNALNPA